MKKRLISLLLAVLMIFAVAPLTVSAANLELKDIIAAEQKKPSGTGYIYYIDDTVYVTTDTVIPSNFTISLIGNGKIVLSAKLTVYGQIANGTTGNIVKVNGTEGEVVYSSLSHWTKYDEKYPFTYYPVSGPYCVNCGYNTVHWCSVCGTYHCAVCQNHYSKYSEKYCHIHNTEKEYCTMCGKYYCPYCEGGYHGRTTSDTECRIIPMKIESYVCNIHNTGYCYCTACSKYYCPECEGGYHIPTTAGCYIQKLEYTSANCPIHKTPLIYCKDCSSWYCPTCAQGYHNGYNTAAKKCNITKTVVEDYFCKTHNCAKQYCSHCSTYYCPYCIGGYHVYNAAEKVCKVTKDFGYYDYPLSSLIYNPYYDVEVLYVPGWGLLPVSFKNYSPKASVPSGSVVANGSLVSLYTNTPGAVIYYTTDGSAPSPKSTVYTAPIAINDNMTIKAIAVAPKSTSSNVATFVYTVKTPVVKAPAYTDVASYKGLNEILEKLHKKGIITETGEYKPEGTVSWDELREYLIACGVSVNTSKFDSSFFADAKAITFEELIHVTYKILRSNNQINTPRRGTYGLKQLKYGSEITNKAIIRASYCSLVENKVVAGTDFHPQSAANRLYLAYILNWCVDYIR